MFFFLVKKAFFDGWDNLGTLILTNLGTVALMALGTSVPYALRNIPVLSIATLVVVLLAIFVYLGTASRITKEISDYKRPEFREIPRYFRETWKSSLAIGSAATGFVVVAVVGIRFYARVGNVLGIAAISLLFWASVVIGLALIWFFPVRDRLGGSFATVLRKSFLLLFDNTILTVLIGLWSLILLIMSGFLAFLMPGTGGIFLAWNDAMRLVLLKYDYLEENPEANRKRIPWDALLIDERERVGKRSLRDMIFPWKM